MIVRPWTCALCLAGSFIEPASCCIFILNIVSFAVVIHYMLFINLNN